MATGKASAKKPAKRVASPAAQLKLEAQHRAGMPALHAALSNAGDALAAAKLLRSGRIVVNSGSGAGGLALEHGAGGTRLVPLDAAESASTPHVEVIGDPRRIAAIVRGEKDARMQFFAGGIRVRGDIAYLSEIGMKLGFLDRPLI